MSGTAAIAQAMRGSSGSNDGAKGMKRIVLIKDKLTMASWGFAFVEFIDVRVGLSWGGNMTDAYCFYAQSASAVLAATMSSSLHPNGFRISDKPVAASFAHPYSFQPLQDGVPDDSCLPSSLSLGGIEDAWVKYWDENSTVGVMEFKVEEPVEVQVDSAKGKREKKKVKSEYKSDDSTLKRVSSLTLFSVLVLVDVTSAAPIEASILATSSKPVTLSFGKAPTTSSISNQGTGSALISIFILY